MALSDFINVSISISAVFPSGPSFSIPLIASYHTVWPDRVRSYNNLAGLVSDGFTVSSPTYKAAAALLGGSHPPPLFMVGRRAIAYTQITTITVETAGAVAGVVYHFTVGGIAISYTVPSAQSTTQVATSLAGLITTAAPANLSSAVGSGAVVSITATAGFLIDLDMSTMPTPQYRTLVLIGDGTTLAGSGSVATDLAAIQAANNGWYGFCLDSNGTTEVDQAMAYAQSNGVIGYFNTMDSTAANSVDTSSVMYTAQLDLYTRELTLFSGTQLLSYSGAALLGNQFSFAPGSATNAYKTLPGVPVDNLTETEFLAITAKNGNTYSNQGLNYTQKGVSADGAFFDIIRGIDSLKSAIQFALLGLLANNPKVSMDDYGIAQVQNTISGVLQQYQEAPYNFLAVTPKYTVTVPLAASLSPSQRAPRNLPNVFFTAQLAGAIQSVTIVGSVSA